MSGRLYSTLQEVLEQVQQLDQEDTNLLMNAIESHPDPETKRGLRSILKAAQKWHADQSGEIVEPQASKGPERLLREIEAILRDESFVPTSQALLEQLKVSLGAPVYTKESLSKTREELVQDGLRAFSSMDEPKLSRGYRQLRKHYLKNRKSSLEEWSEILSGPKK